jgi:N-acetylglucosaminyl-diphospho-decaprenol L-rhamnosyltransferase
VSAAEVAAILVNYNAGPMLRDALQSIADELAGRNWEAIVVDNASTDGSEAAVLSFAPRARLIRNEQNVGFARGVNQGLAQTAAPLILIMNPDCRLMPGAFATLKAGLERRDLCAIVGPRVLDPDGSVQGSARGDPDILTGLFGRTTLLRKILPDLPVSRRNVVSTDMLKHARPHMMVDWLSGACMLARRDALVKVNGFDERYFLYWEDADICRRLRSAGYHVRYVPGAVAVHQGGVSSNGVRAAAIRAFHDSAYLYYVTHVAPGGPRFGIPRRIRRRMKRTLARVILSTRCWWHLRLASGGPPAAPR